MRVTNKFTRVFAGLLAWFCIVSISSAQLIYVNLNSNGTGASTFTYGTTWDSANQTVSSWGSSYTDYQFQLQSPSSLTLNNFYVQISASLRNLTPVDGTGILGAAWFSGAITANPSYSSAIATATMNTALLSSDRAAFSTLLMGPGAFSPSQSITSSPSAYFIRVWANGSNSNRGIELELVSNADITYNPSGSSMTMINWNGSSYVPTSTFTPVGYAGPSIAPEPSQMATSIVLLFGIAGYAFLKRRKSAKAWS